ncbi:helicase HerA-like domain-containing protein [Escherichia coli]
MVERLVIAPASRMGPVTEDERNGLIDHSPVYGKYEDDVDRESAYEMLQKGFQAGTEQQNNPPAKGKRWRWMTDSRWIEGYFVWHYRTTRREERWCGANNGQSAARQVTNQIVVECWGVCWGGEK